MSSPNTLHVRNNTSPDSNAVRMRREHWRKWREVLRHHQLQGIVAWMLDAGAPLALLSAQLLYISGRRIGGGTHQLAQLLESDEETTDFLRYLESDLPDAQELPPGLA